MAAPCTAATVQDIVNQISQSSWRNYLDNSLYTHSQHNRVFNSVTGGAANIPGAQHDLAAEAIYVAFRRTGWLTYYDPFRYTEDGTGKVWSGKNIIAVKQGTTNPDDIYIVSSHYDSTASRDGTFTYAPGADDSASGIAGLLEMARVMVPYTFGATIVLAAFDGEEWNFNSGGVNIRRIGSMHYSNSHTADNILGMVSFDMITWNNGSNIGRLETGWGSQNSGINAAMTSALQTYGGLGVSTNNSNNYSDHVSFANRGIPALMLIEYSWSNNPNYHRQTDSVDTASYIDYTYGTKMLKSVCGWVCTQAGVTGGP